jgi:hypothetical protein
MFEGLPVWSREWVIYAGWRDLAFLFFGLVLILLLILWWRQQSSSWFRIAVATLLASLLLTIASYYLFVMPAYTVGCPAGCAGWRGYPLRIARVGLDGRSEIAVLDFALNVALLWLLWLTGSVVWRLAAVALRWELRSTRWKVGFLMLTILVPWALLPRVLNPPQPIVEGEDLRLINNARRAAEFTYGITGLVVQRLAVEDMRRNVQPGEGDATAAAVRPGSQVCLRGYTYFFIPWQRYRISLDANGATALNLVELPLSGSCWQTVVE